jgi:hypothetical protein
MSEIVIRFGEVTTSEICVMLEASAESGTAPLAESILAKMKSKTFHLDRREAEYLADNLLNDADRVAQACGDAAGRAFERAGERLGARLKELVESSD